MHAAADQVTSVLTRAELREFRDAVAATAMTRDPDSLGAPDPAWRERWADLAAIGATGLCIDATAGGAGDQVQAAAVTASELGAGLHGAPFASLTAAGRALSAVLGTETLKGRPADAARVQAVVDGLLAGTHICVLARWEPADASASRVEGAGQADSLLLMRADGTMTLFDDPRSWTALPPVAPFDLSREIAAVSVLDPSAGLELPAIAKMTPTGTTAAPTGEPAAGPWDVATLLWAADALGGARRALERTVAYAEDRIAFGRPIGSFQAVQHRLADHAVQLRGLDLLVEAAAVALQTASEDAHRRLLVAAAGVSAGVVPLLHDLVQLTGGIGFTWEYGLHFHQRRAHADAMLSGGPLSPLHGLAAEEGWVDA